MNILKYYFLKKFWHNKRQGMMVSTFLLAALTFLFCYRPAYRWVSDFINDNLLLSFTIAVLLFVKFIISRMYYIAKINEGDVNARGCANSSCQLTLLLFILLTILTLKCCKKYTHFSSYTENPTEMASSKKQNISPTHDGRNLKQNVLLLENRKRTTKTHP